MKQFLLAGMAMLFAISSSLAQVTTSNIRGFVTDDQGQPLLGANVVAIPLPQEQNMVRSRMRKDVLTF